MFSLPEYTIKELYFHIRQARLQAGWSEYRANLYASKWTWSEFKKLQGKTC